jgi:molybdenum cofactor cytidylyltransferase
MTRTGLILLAAGSSSRMGRPKQLLPYRGTTLLGHAVATAKDSGCTAIVVVLGANAAEIGETLSGQPVEVVENLLWPEGMGTSIQAGVSALAGRDLDGVILALADQPLVTPATLRGLVDAHRSTGKPIVAAQYAGTAGVPVYFHRSYFPALLALSPNQGCKGVILGNRADALLVDCPEAAMDIDTPDDYLQAKESAG